MRQHSGRWSDRILGGPFWPIYSIMSNVVMRISGLPTGRTVDVLVIESSLSLSAVASATMLAMESRPTFLVLTMA